MKSGNLLQCSVVYFGLVMDTGSHFYKPKPVRKKDYLVLDIHQYYLRSSLGRTSHLTTFDDANGYSKKLIQSVKLIPAHRCESAGLHILKAKVDIYVESKKLYFYCGTAFTLTADHFFTLLTSHFKLLSLPFPCLPTIPNNKAVSRPSVPDYRKARPGG